MSLSIWKYTIPLRDQVTILMQKGARILSAQAQGPNAEDISVWAIIDPNVIQEYRQFRVVGTGHPLANSFQGDFIDTIQFFQGNLVFHLFETTQYPQEH